MTIGTDIAASGPFYPDGVAVAFPFEFDVVDATDVAAVWVSLSGAITPISSASYTVTISAIAGGTITFAAAPVVPVAGDTLWIILDPAFDQQDRYSDEGPFNQSLFEGSIDRGALRSIYLRDRIDRVPALLPFGEEGVALPPAAERLGGKVLGFNAATGAQEVQGAGSFKGDPGGNILAVGLFSQVPTLVIPAGTDIIRTAGWSVAGIGSAFYVRDGTDTWSAKATTLRAAAIAGGVAAAVVDAALTATEGRFRVRDALGGYWRLSADQLINDLMFGAIHDATYDSAAAWNARWSGTDCRAAIQAMIDWGIYFGGAQEGRIAPGNVLIGDTIHVGYGQEFDGNYVLRGEGTSYDGSYHVAGAMLVRNFAGKPLINVQGARGIVLDAFSTWGTSFKYINDSGFANIVIVPSVDDTVGANWHDPAIVAGVGHDLDERYRPDAAITVDAYSGNRPAGSYPDAVYPGWLATSLTQWNKKNSSEVSIFPTHGVMRGEINCVVVHPSDSDGNGDFVTIGRIGVNRCKRVLSVGQSQSRSTKIGYCTGGQVYEFVTNNTHGRQQGQLNAGFGFVTISGLMRLFTLGSTSFTGPLTFDNLYIEALWTIGSIAGGGASDALVKIVGGKISCDLQGEVRGYPAKMITCPGGKNSVIIDGCSISNIRALVSEAAICLVGGTLIENELADAFAGNGIVRAYANYNNATAGGVIPLAGICGAWESKVQHRDIDTGNTNGTQRLITNGIRDCDRTQGMPIVISSAQAPATDENGVPSPDRTVNNPWFGIPQNLWPGVLKSAMTTPAAAGTAGYYDWTFSYPYPTPGAETRGMACGDVLYDNESGMTFLIVSFDRATGATVARALTGIRKVGGVWQPIGAFDPTSGAEVKSLMLRRFIPANPVYADFTAASANLANVARRDGSQLGAVFAVGDYMDHAPEVEALTTQVAFCRVTAVDFVAKTATLSGAAARTVAAQRLPSFVRIVA